MQVITWFNNHFKVKKDVIEQSEILPNNQYIQALKIIRSSSELTRIYYKSFSDKKAQKLTLWCALSLKFKQHSITECYQKLREQLPEDEIKVALVREGLWERNR